MATDLVINPDRFQTFFNDLETHKSLLTTLTDLHKTVTTHFTSLQQFLSQKSQTLDSQIEDFNAQNKKALESLENRENAIPERESAAAARIEEQRGSAIADIENSEDLGGERVLSEVLRMYFRRMDFGGLVRFLLVKRKESVGLRTDIAAAVEEAVDPLRLVLDAVEDFVEMKVEGKVGIADRRWACGMLIQAAVPVPLVGGVAGSLRERAAGVLEKWKGVLGGGEGSSGVGAGEASMFLQMVIGLGLKEKFDMEFLRNLVLEFAARRDMAKLAVALGFEEKMEDIIDELVKSGKEIEAVYFASESGLTERFPPVELLKSCLRNCRKNANTISKNGKYNTAAVEEANNSELIATRAIIKCVEDHKLESQFTIDSLKKRVTQLEKAKADKKKSAASTSKPSNKRHHGGSGRGRGSGPPSFRPAKAGRFSNASPAFPHRNPQHQLPAARFSAPYSYPTPRVYDGPSTAPYGPVYGGTLTQSPASYGPGYGGTLNQSPVSYGAGYGGTLNQSPVSYGAGYGGTLAQSPARLPQQYSLASQDLGAGGVRAGGSYAGHGSYGGQSNYGAYEYAAAPAAVPTYHLSHPSSYPQ